MQIQSIPLADCIFFLLHAADVVEKRRLCFTSSVCGLVIQLFFFFPSLSLTSLFFKLPTESAACTCLKWEDFEVQQLCQRFFCGFYPS